MLKKVALSALLLMFGLLTPQVFAGDLGGSCCQDLEERIAELEVLAVRKGNRRVSVELYGQVSKSMLWVNDGSSTQHQVIDNGVSPTRIGVSGAAKVNADWQAGYKIEIAVNDHPSIPILQDQLTVRHNFWWLSSPAGKLSVGLTSMATDHISSISVVNTDVASRMLSLQPLSNVFLGSLDLPFNELRRNLIRWDSPSMGGFTVSGSYVNGDTPLGFGYQKDHLWDVAIRYSGEFGGFRVAAGAGYSQQDNNLGIILGMGGRDRVTSGSASVHHIASGLFVNGAYGYVQQEQLFGGQDYRVGQMQAGWQGKLFPVGATTIFGEYAMMDFSVTTASPTMWGGGVTQAIDAAAMDLFVSGRVYSLDNGSNDITAVMAGARIRF